MTWLGDFGIIYLIIFICLGLSVMNHLLFSKNGVFCAFSLIVLFVNSAIIVLALGKYFFGMLYILIYVGAVAVIFIYMTMLLDMDALEEDGDPDLLKFTASSIYSVFFYLMWLLSFIILDIMYSGYKASVPYRLIDYVVTTWDDQKFDIMLIGSLMYEEMPLGFELTGIILCVALVGVIALLLQSRTEIKRQNRSKQRLRSYKTSIRKVSKFYCLKGNKRV